MIRNYFLLLMAGVCAFGAAAQKSYNEQVRDYIAQFKDLAIAEQQRSGVPASITLAQGIFETGAGTSELCTNASNHFGIKCKNTWSGETYTYTDDAKDECFRKYSSATHSYQDHSDFLKNNKRYSSLFALSPTDYAAWAYGLKRCGYATNPQYAKKLIKTIEDYNLQEYTYAALGDNAETVLLASAESKAAIPRSQTVATVMPGEHIPADDVFVPAGKAGVTYTDGTEETEILQSAPQEREESGVKDYYQTTTRNGKKGFYARKGDMLLEYAIRNRVRYAKLLELNDLPDAPLEADMFIYLERKAKAGRHATHTVTEGETLLQVSQSEGIQLQQLRAYNLLEKGEEPAAGAVLNLQAPATEKPQLLAASGGSNATERKRIPRLSNDEGFVPAGKQNQVAITEEDTEEEQAASGTAEKVNIADEQPVEEVIAAERATQKQVPAKDESKMTALEKLKAHMDKTVYAAKEFEPKSTGNYDEEPAEAPVAAQVTTPARKNTRATAEPHRQAEERNKKTEAKARPKIKVHTVKRGETLFQIAQKYDMSVAELQKINKLGRKTIQPGMKLKLAR